MRLGSRRNPRGRAGIRYTRGVLTDLRQAVARGFIRPRAVAPVPDFAPFRYRSPAATGAAAEDAAQCRGTGPATGPRTGLMENRQAVAGTLDDRTSGLARIPQVVAYRSPELRHAVAATATGTEPLSG